MQTKFITCCTVAALGFMACKNKNASYAPTEQTTITNTVALINEVSKDMFTHLDASTQSFVISATKATKVVAKSGFELDVDPAKLALQSNRAVAITIKECLNTDALLAANAATVSNGKMLVSGGSYYIEATQDGKKIDIKSGERLAIRAPKLHAENMELFYGTRDAAGNMNWTTTQEQITETKISKQGVIKVPMQVTEKVIAGDSIVVRPASLATCLKIHYDSTMKARWDYTRANRDKFTYAQEIRYGLQPIKFPFERFMKNIAGKEKAIKKVVRKYGTFEYDSGYSNALSYMYVTKDTLPLYKDSVYTKMVDNMSEVYTIYQQSYIGNLGWINIDRFLKEPMCDSTTITLNTKLEDMRIYYKFLDINSMLTETKSANELNVLPINTKLPLGKKVEMVIVGRLNNTVYTSKQVFVIERKNFIKVALSPITEKKQV